MAKLPKFLRIRENRVDEHDGEVRFKTGSGNMTVSCMKNMQYNRYYRNSLVIVDMAMGQIQRSTSTERYF